MLFLDVFLLSLIQSITEFMPISSSAHLVLLENMLELNTGIFFDIALHFGSLLAIFMYYYKDFIKMFKSLFNYKNSQMKMERGFILKLITATIPLVIAGIFIYDISSDTRNIKILAINSIVFGILLWVIDKYSKGKKESENLTYKQALIIGIFQILSLIPGVSRSGITITAGRMVGLSREACIKFSVFLAIPAIAGAFILGVYKNINTYSFSPDLLYGMLLTFAMSYIFLKLFISFSKKFSFAFFGAYRVILGLFLLK